MDCTFPAAPACAAMSASGRSERQQSAVSATRGPASERTCRINPRRIGKEPPPRVSIGMPVYNSERWLEQTLRTLRAQTLTDFELIISDNASTDATRAICTGHASQDRRIRYYRNARNIGSSRNYMKVLALARADYFKWASSHDLCDLRFLEHCVTALEAQPDAALAYPKTMVFSDSPGDAMPYDADICAMQDSAAARFTHVMCHMKMNTAMNGVFRTRVLRRAHAMGCFYGADRAMMAEIALLGKFVLVPERLFFYRKSEETATHLMPRSEQERHYRPDATSPLHWQRWQF